LKDENDYFIQAIITKVSAMMTAIHPTMLNIFWQSTHRLLFSIRPCQCFLFRHKGHHHKQCIHQSTCQCNQISCAVQRGRDSAQEEVDGKQNPRQRVSPAENKETEASSRSHGFVGPYEGVNHGDREGERGPEKPGEIEEAFDHIISSVIAGPNSRLVRLLHFARN